MNTYTLLAALLPMRRLRGARRRGAALGGARCSSRPMLLCSLRRRPWPSYRRFQRVVSFQGLLQSPKTFQGLLQSPETFQGLLQSLKTFQGRLQRPKTSHGLWRRPSTQPPWRLCMGVWMGQRRLAASWSAHAHPRHAGGRHYRREETGVRDETG